MDTSPPATSSRRKKVGEVPLSPLRSNYSINQTHTVSPTTNSLQRAMAGLTGAIQALVAHRDALFLKRLAEDYKLDLAELTSKYLEAPAPVEKKKRQIKVKVSADGKEIRCQGQTAKKEQCSFQPLAGKCFCKRHLPADLPAPAPASEPEEQLEFGLPTIPEEEPKSAAERLQELLPLFVLLASEEQAYDNGHLHASTSVWLTA